MINLVLTPCLLQVILGGGVPDAGHLNRTVLLRWTTRFVCTDSLSMVGRTAVDKRTDREIGKIKQTKDTIRFACRNRLMRFSPNNKLLQNTVTVRFIRVFLFVPNFCRIGKY